MKKILFTRLHARIYEYSTYLSSGNNLGTLRNAIADDFLPETENGILFITHHNDMRIVGLLRKLPLKDSVGRTRTAFLGYELEKHEPFPSFEAFKEKMDKIHSEAVETSITLEALLDKGKQGNELQHLRETNIIFRNLPLNTTNSVWDCTVDNYKKHSEEEFIKMFDANGKELVIAKRHFVDVNSINHSVHQSIEPDITLNLSDDKKAKLPDSISHSYDTESDHVKKNDAIPRSSGGSSGLESSSEFLSSELSQKSSKGNSENIQKTIEEAIHTGENPVKSSKVAMIIGGVAVAAVGGYLAWKHFQKPEASEQVANRNNGGNRTWQERVSRQADATLSVGR